MEAGAVVGGKYHLVRPLGEGGMGAVYDAIHTKTGRRVALKMIREAALHGRTALQRFEREARAAAAIDSIHVVQVLDSGEDEPSGLPYLVLELLEGHDLRRFMNAPIAPELAIKVALQVAQGLVRAHENEVVHRDLKPANLFLAKSDGERRIVKILDFGIAKIIDDDATNLTGVDDLIGSPAYMSPEQLTTPREVDARTDIWSLGVVLYEMLTGHTPTSHITGSLSARIGAICNDPAPRVDCIPALADVVARALTIDKDTRFRTATELRDALAALTKEVDIHERDLDGMNRAQEPLHAGATTSTLRPAPVSRRRGWPLALIGAGAVLAIYGLVHALRSEPAPPQLAFPPPPALPSAEPTASVTELDPSAAPPASTASAPKPRVRPPPKRDSDHGRDRF